MVISIDCKQVVPLRVASIDIGTNTILLLIEGLPIFGTLLTELNKSDERNKDKGPERW
jgi:hypothetical protein